MANDHALDPLGDPLELVSGRILRASPMQAQLGGRNDLLAAAQTRAPLYQVRRPLGAVTPWASYTGAAWQAITSVPLLVPSLSDKHLTVTIEVDIGVGAGDGATVRATAVTSTATVLQPVAPAGRAVVTLPTLTIAAAGDSVLLEVSSTAPGHGSQIDIYGLWIYIDPLADPLPAADISGVEAAGVDRADDDLPHSAVINHRIRSAAEHLYERPRRVWSWVGLDPALGAEFMADRYLQVAPLFVELATVQTVTVYLNVDNSLGGDTSIALVVGDDVTRVPDGIFRIDVPAATDGWVSAQLVLPERASGLPWEESWIGVWPGSAFNYAQLPIRAALAVSP